MTLKFTSSLVTIALIVLVLFVAEIIEHVPEDKRDNDKARKDLLERQDKDIDLDNNLND